MGPPSGLRAEPGRSEPRGRPWPFSADRRPHGSTAKQRNLHAQLSAQQTSPTATAPDGICSRHRAAGAPPDRSACSAPNTAVLSVALTDALAVIGAMKGSDRSRIITLAGALKDPQHRSWLILDEGERSVGQDALRILSTNPQEFTRKPSRLRSPDKLQHLASPPTCVVLHTSRLFLTLRRGPLAGRKSVLTDPGRALPRCTCTACSAGHP